MAPGPWFGVSGEVFGTVDQRGAASDLSETDQVSTMRRAHRTLRTIKLISRSRHRRVDLSTMRVRIRSGDNIRIARAWNASLRDIAKRDAGRERVESEEDRRSPVERLIDE